MDNFLGPSSSSACRRHRCNVCVIDLYTRSAERTQLVTNLLMCVHVRIRRHRWPECIRGAGDSHTHRHGKVNKQLTQYTQLIVSDKCAQVKYCIHLIRGLPNTCRQISTRARIGPSSFLAQTTTRNMCLHFRENNNHYTNTVQTGPERNTCSNRRALG